MTPVPRAVSLVVSHFHQISAAIARIISLADPIILTRRRITMRHFAPSAAEISFAFTDLQPLFIPISISRRQAIWQYDNLPRWGYHLDLVAGSYLLRPKG